MVYVLDIDHLEGEVILCECAVRDLEYEMLRAEHSGALKHESATIRGVRHRVCE
jgi:hypothetical protein